ncbi:MAG TPA: hypothetical protein VFY23_15820 [Candidatus Limnocylindrales bacterium]|nr:hypothetical protein [Candidatus Limnocylindrales bacterium]
MPPKPPAPDSSEHPPITSLQDPRAIQIMSTEHWSLLSARSLAYNEAFTRGGMFLTFLSMSFVALALVASAMSFTDQFLGITAIVLAFDLAIGLGTFGRIIAANQDDYRALHGMARIRHGYTEAAPMLAPYFTSSVHDDVPGVLVSYGSPQTSPVGQLTYALTTSSGMIGLIVALLAGVLVHVLVLLAGLDPALGFVLAAVAIVLTFLALAAFTARYFRSEQANLPVLFPTPADAAADGTADGRTDAPG